MCLMGRKIFIFYHKINFLDEIPAHPSLEKKNVAEITCQKDSRPGRVGPGRAGPGWEGSSTCQVHLGLFERVHAEACE